MYRNGQLYTKDTIKVYDHDFSYLAEGAVIPHGIYDVKKNSAYMNIGTSHETGEFACDSLKHWWLNQGKYDYPKANSILLLADCGGSNSCRHYIFKENLQKLVDEIQVEIRIAHYPPYSSKWNPIEHRLFPHVTRSLQGVIFTNYKLVKELLENTKTKAGLTVRANIIRRFYETGKKVAEDFKENMKIKFDAHLGKWNYRAIPSACLR